MTKQRGPLKVSVKVSGPYIVTGPDVGWAYQKGRHVIAYATVAWKGELLLISIEIPRALPEPPR